MALAPARRWSDHRKDRPISTGYEGRGVAWCWAFVFQATVTPPQHSAYPTQQTDLRVLEICPPPCCETCDF
ncbi:hypothetical protein AAFF_G00214280 [Aldrovandia affinis]|uniref:Uncharacterized protein n=1 Tax=Aldrovandia affinis TaxID=143900 RepID=A0AAD7RGF7_9TELE|nr:hypothetical protein AAFF_G00214280 [Aldrovandia affinis]